MTVDKKWKLSETINEYVEMSWINSARLIQTPMVLGVYTEKELEKKRPFERQ